MDFGNVISMSLTKAFKQGWKIGAKKRCIRKDHEIRENLSEKQVDRMVEDSFPASDPPSTY